MRLRFRAALRFPSASLKTVALQRLYRRFPGKFQAAQVGPAFLAARDDLHALRFCAETNKYRYRKWLISYLKFLNNKWKKLKEKLSDGWLSGSSPEYIPAEEDDNIATFSYAPSALCEWHDLQILKYTEHFKRRTLLFSENASIWFKNAAFKSVNLWFRFQI